MFYKKVAHIIASATFVLVFIASGSTRQRNVLAQGLRGDVFRCKPEEEGQPVVIPGIETACVTCVCQNSHVNCERIACQSDGSCAANATATQREQCCRRCLQPNGMCQLQAEEAHVSTFDELAYPLDGLLTAWHVNQQRRQQSKKRRRSQSSSLTDEATELQQLSDITDNNVVLPTNLPTQANCVKTYKFLLVKAGCRHRRQQEVKQHQLNDENEDDDEENNKDDGEADEEAEDETTDMAVNKRFRRFVDVAESRSDMDQFEVYVKFHATVTTTSQQQQEQERHVEQQEDEQDDQLLTRRVAELRAISSNVADLSQQQQEHVGQHIQRPTNSHFHRFSLLIRFQRRYIIEIDHLNDESGLRLRINRKRVHVQTDRPFVQIGAFFVFVHEERGNGTKSMRIKFVNGAEIQWHSTIKLSDQSQQQQNQIVRVILPRTQQWQGRTCGLCGDFDDHRHDDLHIPLYARTFPWLDETANAVLAARKWLIPAEANEHVQENNNNNNENTLCDDDEEEEEELSNVQENSNLIVEKKARPLHKQLHKKRRRLFPDQNWPKDDRHSAAAIGKSVRPKWREEDMLPTDDASGEENDNGGPKVLSASSVWRTLMHERSKSKRRHPKIKLYTVWQTLTME